ncbi:lamin tail domain-containing protein [Chryseobacterium indologenes]|uniref:lamin tail domain-containing protein n=1 Tax=Chryseobacterium indologenes TaxID=253 RepID=UPI00076E3182|nr:lamin tail domain-containing protein [Chryseobacterium indologenes]ASE62671.1 nuclease [Chryseobacterium indologenes]AYY84750.1 nuclease [Chryseobacterium indologenes]QIX81636.1 nuclease [Chryseobacterium indologenes]UDQ55397.1 lamin tail domain-containing protein [Chryseobacterium indologenes]VFA42172.1 Por secretion system C-terminal sorting domain [Chryseobacterium indologenes]
MKKIFTSVVLVMVAAFSNAQIVINEIYGGNENSGALLKNNYIVLKNIGTSLVSLTGASIQYAPAIGPFTQYHTLPDLTLGPDQTYLIQEAPIAGGTEDLPAPDFIATTVINFDGTPNKSTGMKISNVSGKIALAGSIVQVLSPDSSNVLDFVGYGSNADQFKGDGPAPSPTTTTAIKRTLNGSSDNMTDFSLEGNAKSGFVQNPFIKDGKIVFGMEVKDAKVYDTFRQVVKKSPTKFALALDITELPRGTYIVTGTINNVPISQKIIKD